MGRKKAEHPVKWKPVRIQQEWIDMMRGAGQKNPSFSPTVDLTTASEPKLLHLACQCASLYISGWFWERLTPDIERIVNLEKLRTAIQVAAHFGAEVRESEDGTLTIVARRKPDYTLPRAVVGFPKPVSQ